MARKALNWTVANLIWNKVVKGKKTQQIKKEQRWKLLILVSRWIVIIKGNKVNLFWATHLYYWILLE